MVLNFRNARLARTVCTAVKGTVGLDPVANDLAPAVIAGGGEFMNSTLEAIENVAGPSCNNFKRKIIIIAADFTLRHRNLLPVPCGPVVFSPRA
jgi:hypothetical protein